MKIAVIGGGIAGISAAYTLSKCFEVTLFEKETRIGGHTNTANVVDELTGENISIDTGFIVLNDCNYGVLHNLFSQWNVDVRWSDMSFSYFNRDRDYYYAGTTLFGIFPKLDLLFSKQHWDLILEIIRFCQTGVSFLKSDEITKDISLGEFINLNGFSANLKNNYLLPMGSAIWSVPLDQILEFPALSFLNFFKNHGLLTLSNRPNWQTVKGGSSTYLEKFKNMFQGKIEIGREVSKVFRRDHHVNVTFNDGTTEEFSEVVFACHADQVLEILDEPTALEQEIFSNWAYQENSVILHTDQSIMPPKKSAWASWNYHSNKGSDATLTYYMNKLQGLKTKQEFFVSLNSIDKIDEKKVLKTIKYTHPIYTKAAVVTQKKWIEVQGKNRSYFCGSYWGEGFHEDAARSGAQVGLFKGITL